MSEERRPVLWATGRRGYITLNPLIAAVGYDRCYTVTADSNPNIAMLREKGTLLGVVPAFTRQRAVQNLLQLAPTLPSLVDAIVRKASVIHIVMSSPLDWLYLSFIRRYRIPTILTIHDYHRHPGEESKVLDFVDQRIRAAVSHFAVLSDNVLQRVVADAQETRPVILAKPGLVTRTEHACGPRRFPQNRPARLIFFGRIQRYKGIDLLLDAFAQVRNRFPDVTLTIAGSGDFSPYRAKADKISGILLHNEWLDDARLCQLLAENDLAIMPYIEASQSGVASDCFWAALPSVVTPIGGLTEQFQAGRHALFAENISAKAIATAIETYLTDSSVYEAISFNCAREYDAVGHVAVGRNWQHIYDRF